MQYWLPIQLNTCLFVLCLRERLAMQPMSSSSSNPVANPVPSPESMQCHMGSNGIECTVGPLAPVTAKQRQYNPSTVENNTSDGNPGLRSNPINIESILHNQICLRQELSVVSQQVGNMYRRHCQRSARSRISAQSRATEATEDATVSAGRAGTAVEVQAAARPLLEQMSRMSQQLEQLEQINQQLSQQNTKARGIIERRTEAVV